MRQSPLVCLLHESDVYPSKRTPLRMDGKPLVSELLRPKCGVDVFLDWARY